MGSFIHLLQVIGVLTSLNEMNKVEYTAHGGRLITAWHLCVCPRVDQDRSRNSLIVCHETETAGAGIRACRTPVSSEIYSYIMSITVSNCIVCVQEIVMCSLSRFDPNICSLRLW